MQPRRLQRNDRGLPWPKETKVYHATAAVRAVLDEGLKARGEIGKHVTGGGTESAISFTLDVRVARSICIGIRFLRLIARGETQLGQTILQAERIAPKGLAETIRSEHTTTEDVVMYDRGFFKFLWGAGFASFNLKSGQLDQVLGSGLAENVKEQFADPRATKPYLVTGWAPFDLLADVTGNEARRTTYGEHVEFYKRLLSFGDFAKELYDPLFFLTDVEALAQIREDDIGIVEATLNADWVCADPNSATDMGFDLSNTVPVRMHDWARGCQSRLDDVAKGRDYRHEVSLPDKSWQQPEPSDTVAYLGGSMAELRTWSRSQVKRLRLKESLDDVMQDAEDEWRYRHVDLGGEQPIAYPWFKGRTPRIVR